ncbi:serine/threonine protein kinase [Fusobacterium ulcerans]|jgi:predicted alpha/beta-fold hydrolase|uniref:serine/threonine protein kinase n=1 Tax=Fusobacterium ulcerans TaxID=861 RepID=UPI000E4776B9|nr:serine/threonine protein kinase [Fusobacterium ulcerans]RGY65137.1 serine/threonine protein kinase [Fusobacterium ulcerans]
MKKIIVTLMILIFSISYGKYEYPFQNPYMATILGSSTLMINGVSETVPTKVYKVKLPGSVEVPENLWYNDKFEFSLVPQKEKAPLIFLLAGTGSDYHAARMVFFQRIFYDAGYSVISITSPMHSNFIVNASSNRMPGMIMDDGKDVYNVMKETYKIVKDKVNVSDFYVVGYSLGATEAAVVSYIDETEKAFNLKRVFMINPAVDIYESAVKLDKTLDIPTEGKIENLEKLIDKVFNKLSDSLKNGYTEITEELIYRMFAKDQMTDEEMGELIGLVFRLTAIDINYVTDLINDRKVYVDKPVGKFTNMFPYFEKINFAGFEDYMYKLAYPYFDEKMGGGVTLEELLQHTKLQQIEGYLKNTDKIAVVTNRDEIILGEKDFEFLEKTFNKRLIIYPYGGHCGNMYYKTNVDVMLKFLKEGVLDYEN